MPWTSEQYKAIAGYAKRHDLRIAMCTHPTARFVDKDGKAVERNINDLVVEHTTNKNEEAREKRRLKVEEENRKPWHERFKSS